jgi:MscS family membrane protein
MQKNNTSVARWLFPVLALALFAPDRLVGGQVPAAPGVAKAATNSAAPVLNAVQAVTSTRESGSDDPLGRATPRGTVMGFVKAADSGDYQAAAQYLNTRQHGELAQKLAEQLKDVLDRDASIDVGRLSRKPEGSAANPDPGQPHRELIGSTSTDTGKLSIWLERIQHGEEPPVWLFSEDTLEQIPDAYNSLAEPSEAEQKLPSWLQMHVLAIAIWRWLLLIVAIAAVFFLGSWVSNLVSPALKKFAQRVGGNNALDKVKSIRAPLRLLFIGVILYIFGSTSSLVLARAFWRNAGLIVIIIGTTWLATRTVGLVTQLSIGRFKRLQTTDKIALTGLIGRLLQIAAVTIGALILLEMRGINLTAALTGLGIGGVAIAFAAQKTLENLFGGIMIISDRPIRIGDHCKIGLVEGHVLDIGLRSTRIRTLERTIVTIPNGQLAIMNVENLTLRDKFRFYHILTLRYDTTAAQMQTVLTGISQLLERDPRVENSSYRANFIAIRSFSDDIEISAYVFAENAVRFYVVQEELLMKIFGIVESAGAALSLPTQVTQILGATPPTALARPSDPPATATGSPAARG